jgi:hypothetical protein
MTEPVWMDWSGDPGNLLNPVRDRIGDRKIRLFACACCRRVWPMLTDSSSQKAVTVAELFADGRATPEELSCAAATARTAAFNAATAATFSPAAHAATCAWYAASSAWSVAFAASNRAAACVGREKESEQRAQCRLFRDVVPNPFRAAPAVDPEWLTWQGGAVQELAQAAYEERRLPEGTLDPQRLAVLADALEDAGRMDAELLGHLRGPGVHVRGCWAVDLLLAKA